MIFKFIGVFISFKDFLAETNRRFSRFLFTNLRRIKSNRL